MAQINEEDVVIAFRQTLEEELKRAQRGDDIQSAVYHDGASTEENLQRLVKAHLQLQSEVALLRTVILKLLSQPVDFNTEPEAHNS